MVLFDRKRLHNKNLLSLYHIFYYLYVLCLKKKIEDLLSSIYHLVHEARNEQKIISYNSNNLEIKKNRFFNDTNKKKVFIEKNDSDSLNNLDFIKDNKKQTQELEITDSEIINKFKFSLENWSRTNLKNLLKDEFTILSKKIIDSKLK